MGSSEREVRILAASLPDIVLSAATSSAAGPAYLVLNISLTLAEAEDELQRVLQIDPDASAAVILPRPRLGAA